jgi:hypothetical protein
MFDASDTVTCPCCDVAFSGERAREQLSAHWNDNHRRVEETRPLDGAPR